MMPYREQIEQAAAEQAVDLLAYYDGPDEVREHLVSIIPSVAVQDGKLCGCTAITYRQDLSEHQWNALFRDIEGQYSDGWGEGFEQRDIEVDGGILNVHFWQPDGFEMIPIAVSSAERTVPERPGWSWRAMTEIFSPFWAGRQSCCGRMGRTRRRSRCAGV